MGLMKKVPLSLRKIFSEVANAPTAVCYLPSVFINPNSIREDKIFNLNAVVTMAGMGLGFAFFPITTALLATPLFLVGRTMQGINQGPTAAQTFFQVDKFDRK